MLSITRKKRIHLITVLLLCLIPLVIIGFSINSRAQSSTEASNKIMVIYDDNLPKALVLKTWLIDQGYNTSLINVSKIMSGVFDDYDLIIAGRDSGYRSEWGNESIRAAVNDTLKPILGIGEGGGALFGWLNLDIGYPHNSYSSLTSLVVVNETHPLFNVPNDVPNGTIQIFTAGTSCVSYMTASPPSDVEVFACMPSSATDYMIVQEAGRYFLWGFEGSPDFFTAVGEDLFLNVLIYLGLEPIPPDTNPSNPDSIPGYNILLFLCLVSTLSVYIIIKQLKNDK